MQLSTSSARPARTICIAEDRPALEPAIRLLIKSLSVHCSAERVDLFFAAEDDSFGTWLADYPNVVYHRERIPGAYTKYDVKPYAFEHLFQSGFDDVLWIDSDILVLGDILSETRALDPDVVLITEEALGDFHDDPNGARARLSGLPVGRELPFCLNTGVLRFTTRHCDLIKRWRDLLNGDAYRQAQEKSWSERPMHLLSDQDVLTALLASEEFARIPLHILRRGRDVIQFFGPYGYTLRERLSHIFGRGPFLVHSMGHKPWWPNDSATAGTFERFIVLYRELSPYTFAARAHSDALRDAAWLQPRSSTARLLAKAGFGSPALNGAPLAAVADARRLMKWMRGKVSPPRIEKR